MHETHKLALEAKRIVFRAQDALEAIDDVVLRASARWQLDRIRGELEHLDNVFQSAEQGDPT